MRSKYFAISEPREGVGEALRADRFQALLKIADFVLRQHQPLFQSLVGLAHLARRPQERLHDTLDLGSLGGRKLLAGAVQAGIVIRGHAECVSQEAHHIVDFANHARTDLVDAIGGLDVREIGLVDLLEIGFGQIAVARQRLVDDLVERSVVTRRVDVPDFVVAGHGGLTKRPDLPERNFGKGHRAFVFVEHLDHGLRPHSRPGRLPQQ
jgi:hypothetical protein